MSRRPAKAPDAAPVASVRVRNPGSGLVILSGPGARLTVPGGATVDAPGWVASHPAVVGERPILALVEG